jgi:CRISPR-associated protein Csx16
MSVLAHLPDPPDLLPGDHLYGVLPIHLAARLCAQGVKVWAIEVVLPEALRGQELSAGQLQDLGARLVRYQVVAYESIGAPAAR